MITSSTLMVNFYLLYLPGKKFEKFADAQQTSKAAATCENQLRLSRDDNKQPTCLRTFGI